MMKFLSPAPCAALLTNARHKRKPTVPLGPAAATNGGLVVRAIFLLHPPASVSSPLPGGPRLDVDARAVATSPSNMHSCFLLFQERTSEPVHRVSQAAGG